jgi:hypothetical protein
MTATVYDPLGDAIAGVVAATAELVANNERTMSELRRATEALRALTAERDDAVAARDHFAERLADARSRIAVLERRAPGYRDPEAQARAIWDSWAHVRRHHWQDEPA